MSGGGASRFLTTVLMTDMVSSTELAAELGDRGWRELVQLHNALVREALRRHDGREMDTAGDGFFAIFDAPGSAILCALEIVDRAPAIGVHVRAGVHVGEVEQMGGKVGGITVPIASRISAAAGPGEVLVSTTVRDLAAGAGLRFEDRGSQVLKGVPGEWRLYKVSQRGAEPADTPSPASADLAGQRMAAIRRSQARPPWQRHPRAAAAVATGLAVIVVGGAVLAWSPWRPQALAAVPANALGIIDAERNEIVGEVEVGQQPTAIAHGEDGVWVANSIDATVQRIDPERQVVVHTVDVGLAPVDLAVAEGSVWVANSNERSVSRINIETGRVVQTITVGNSPSAIAAGAGEIWVINRGDGTVMRLNGATGELLGEPIPVGVAPSGLAVDDSGAWVISEETGTLAHLDPATGWPSTPIAVGPRPIAVATGAGSVWVASATDGTITRVDQNTRRVTGVYAAGGSPSDLVVHADEIWVGDLDGFVRRLDARAPDAPAVTIASVSGATALAPAHDAIWFAAVASTATHSGGTLRVAGSLGLPFLEPGIVGVSHQWWTLMGDGLLAYPRRSGAGGAQLVPALAESMPSITDGRRTYSFRLRSGLVYSNGQPVRAEDFRNTIERLFQVEHPGIRGPLDGPVAFGAIRGAEACMDAPVPRCDLSDGIVTDAIAGTITFHLTEPDPDFLFSLADRFPVPLDAAPPNAVAKKPVPGTGPYMIAEYSETQYQLVRNPHFESWSQADRPNGLVDEIIILDARNLEDRTLSLQDATEMVVSGEADWVHPFMDAAQIPELRTQSPAQLHSNPSFMTIMFMDTTRPPFDSLEARQAVNLALDRALLAEMRGGAFAATPSCQTLPPVSVGYRPYCPWTAEPNAGGQWTAPDLQAAQRLVDQSGTRGARVVVGPMPTRFNADVAPYVVSVLEDLGYDVSLETVDQETEAGTAVFVERRVQISIWGVGGSTSSADFLGAVACADSGGLTNHCDPDLDARIAAAREAELTDPAAAAEAYAAIDREITDLALVTPLVNEGTTFVSSRVHGVQHHLAWGLLLDLVWLD